MVLYTIAPEYSIFPEEEQSFQHYKNVSVHGVPMVIQQMDTDYEIVRVLSTNPQDYLDYQPGQKIRF